MNRDTFTERIDEYLKSVRREALRLFDDGVMAEHALNLAEQIANSQETKRALTRQQLTGLPNAVPNIRRN